MPERVYTEYPALYDAIQSEWDYDRDVAFVLEALSRYGNADNAVLEVGCGTGEHTRRLVDEGFSVTAIDKFEGMLDLAHVKCEADFRQMALPNLSVDDDSALIVGIRGVINHLSRDDFTAALEALSTRLADGGVLIFDNSPLPPDGNQPALDVGTMDRGDYARIAQHVKTEDDRLDWREIVFTPDGEFFVNSRKMTPFDDETIATELSRQGLSVETFDGYGPEDHRTVFVATA